MFRKFTAVPAIALLVACSGANDKPTDGTTEPVAENRQTSEAKMTPSEHVGSADDNAKPSIDPSPILVDPGDSGTPPPVVHTPTGPANKQAVLELSRVEAESSIAADQAAMSVAAPTYRLRAQRVAEAGVVQVEPDRENYAAIDDIGVTVAADTPVSTLSVDVDTGAYANVRRILREGRLPPEDAVRVEELINYFDYDYATAAARNAPFALTRELAPAPWDSNKHLLHIGLKGFVPENVASLSSNLVFLLDVSGSMNSPDKLGLLKYSLKQLTKQLDENDSVATAAYAGASGVVLEPTPGNEYATIAAALDQLQAGGSTNGEAGIKQAYALAARAFIKDGVNRVILATDGDFNVGTTNIDALKELIEDNRERGIALTTLGFGRGNYNDALMEQLADIGNGNYAYIDTPNEARKVLVEELSATMMTIAKDVKIQIEFNPAVVAEYRLIGYENRLLAREDFNNDKIDAGEIGAGHTVTAIYEIALVGSEGRLTDPLRYGATNKPAISDELAFLRLRYKQPGGDESALLEWPIQQQEMQQEWRNASENFRFSAAVAAFGQQLRGADYLSEFDLDDTITLAQSARGDDPFGYRAEFVAMVRMADSLQPVPAAANWVSSR